MSAADNPKRDGGQDPIVVTHTTGEREGQTETLPYRQAVGLLSLQRAVLADDKPKPRKRTAKK